MADCQHDNTIEITPGSSLACLDCQCVLVDLSPWHNKKDSFRWLVNHILIADGRLLELLNANL